MHHLEVETIRRFRDPASFSEAFADVCGHFKTSWLVLMMKRPSNIYGCSKNTAHNTARKSLWLVANFSMALVSVRDEYAINLTVPSSCSCRSTHRSRDLHSLMATVDWPVVCGSVRPGGFISSVFRLSTAFLSALVKEGTVVGWSFRSLLFNGVTTFGKFERDRRNMLQRHNGVLSEYDDE